MSIPAKRTPLSERRLLKIARPIIIIVALIATWQLTVTLTGAPKYMLPTPIDVWHTLITRYAVLFDHARYTIADLAGVPSHSILCLGSAFGPLAGIWFGIQNRHGCAYYFLPGHRRLF